jgi:hypothetical protein
MNDKFDHLFVAKKSMFGALRDAGLRAAKPQRNVHWVNQADDGATILNVWRHTLRKSGALITSDIIFGNRAELIPSRKRKRDEVREILKEAVGATVRVILLDERVPRQGLTSGCKYDPLLWSVHGGGDRYELRRGGKGRAEYLNVPIVPAAFGVLKPKKRFRVSEQIERLVRVKRETLKRAHNKCEIANCADGRDFTTPDVHHITRLGSLGSDHTDNTVALCPACHARVHRGIMDVRVRLEAAVEEIRRNRS